MRRVDLMDGVINFFKNKGITSFQAVKKVREITGEKKCGHGGTLDPLAEGVLPVFLGKATKIIQFVVDSEKRYSATIMLGMTTDTLDSEGKTIKICEGGAVPLLSDVEKALSSFTGRVKQVPPMFSAVKHKGRRLYKIAREGRAVERIPREIEIEKIDVISFKYPFLKINVTCSPGTYIRQLASDIGDKLECGGHICELVRLRSGVFDIEESKGIDEIKAAVENGMLRQVLLDMDLILSRFAEIKVTGAGEKKVRDGAPVTMEDVVSIAGKLVEDGYCRIKGTDSGLIAIGQSKEQKPAEIADKKQYVFKMKKVFN